MVITYNASDTLPVAVPIIPDRRCSVESPNRRAIPHSTGVAIWNANARPRYPIMRAEPKSEIAQWPVGMKPPFTYTYPAEIRTAKTPATVDIIPNSC